MIAVVAGHPDPQSFSAALAATYVTAAREVGADVVTLDLADASFDPVLRMGYRARMAPDAFVERSIDTLQRASHLAVFFPTWWAAEPSLLKGWFDRVLTPGIAYRYRPGKATPDRLLTGRTATLVTTSHAPAWYARVNPRYPVRRLSADVLGYCGIKVTRALVLGGMDGRRDTPQHRADFVETVRRQARLDARR